MTATLRVLSLSTLYPTDLQPNFGVFVERQMQAVTKRGDVDLIVVNPIGIPPAPLSLHPRYRSLPLPQQALDKPYVLGQLISFLLILSDFIQQVIIYVKTITHLPQALALAGSNRRRLATLLCVLII